jgi:hypothetical protein
VLPLMTCNPANRLGLCKGRLAVGCDADILLIEASSGGSAERCKLGGDAEEWSEHAFRGGHVITQLRWPAAPHLGAAIRASQRSSGQDSRVGARWNV